MYSNIPEDLPIATFVIIVFALGALVGALAVAPASYKCGQIDYAQGKIKYIYTTESVWKEK